jgi:hypothetical protein
MEVTRYRVVRPAWIAKANGERTILPVGIEFSVTRDAQTGKPVSHDLAGFALATVAALSLGDRTDEIDLL